MKVGTTKAPATARTPSGVRGTEPGPFPLLHKRRLASHTASPYRAKHDGRNFSRRWSKRSPSVYLHSCPKPSGARSSSLESKQDRKRPCLDVMRCTRECYAAAKVHTRRPLRPSTRKIMSCLVRTRLSCPDATAPQALPLGHVSSPGRCQRVLGDQPKVLEGRHHAIIFHCVGHVRSHLFNCLLGVTHGNGNRNSL